LSKRESNINKESTYHYDDEIFEITRRYGETNFWYISRRELIIWAVGKYFSSAKNAIDIGCGTGFNLLGIKQSYPALGLHGCDASQHSLQIARSSDAEIEFFESSIYELNSKEKFDLVMALDVLEHLDEDVLALKNIYNLLADNGGAIITVPQHPFLWSPADEYAHHVRRYTAKELISKATEAGFKVDRKTSFVTSLFPLMVASRLFDRIMKRPYDFEKELAVGRFNNFLFRNILSLERSLIRLGLSFPFGGSLMLVLRK
jgi:SAM-dependent methyltransferase